MLLRVQITNYLITNRFTHIISDIDIVYISDIFFLVLTEILEIYLYPI